MSDDSRVQRFRSEVAELKVAAARRGPEQLLLTLAVLLMVGGIVVALGAFLSSRQSSADNVGIANQNDMVVLALAGVASAVTGAALYVRQSFARFLRFWMVRQLYESHLRDGAVVSPTDTD